MADDKISEACKNDNHESEDTKSCVWCRCSCHYLKQGKL